MEELLALATPGRLTAVGVLAMLAAGVWRMVLQWRKEDRVSEAGDRIRDDLIAQNRDLLARADGFAKQRNDALRELAQAEGTVRLLNERIDAYGRHCPFQRECGMPTPTNVVTPAPHTLEGA